MTSPYEWYQIAPSDAPLEQGDIFYEFPVIIKMLYSDEPNSSVPYQAGYQSYNVILMTQSCDLERIKDDELVVLCSIASCREAQGFNCKDQWGQLIRNRIVSAHLLDRCDIEGYEFDHQVVFLREMFTTPIGFVRQFAKNHGARVRLLSPYREHLAQAFATQFMRIGLPKPLPRKYPYDN